VILVIFFLAENASRFAAVHSKRPFHCFAPVNSLSHGANARARAPVQSGDEYPAAVEQAPDLR
jgi:hypothetical protein